MRPFTRTRAIAALALVAAAALAVPIGAVGQEPTVREPMTFGYEPPPGWSSEDVVDTRPYETNIPWSICFANGHPLGAWRIQSIRSLENEVQLYPDLIEDFTRTDDEGDPTRLAEDITDCVVRGVDAILVVPIDDPAVAEAVKAAQDAGVPVVAFHEPLQGTDVTAYVGTDVCQKGSQLADWLIANVPTESRVIALGDEGTHGRQAWACAERALVDGGLEVLEYRDTYGDPIAAEEVCAELLATHPRIDGIWSDTGEAGMGCVTAFRTAGRPLVPVTGDDYNGLLRLYSELSA
jgi:ribose transport system substrate-binding protein